MGMWEEWEMTNWQRDQIDVQKVSHSSTFSFALWST